MSEWNDALEAAAAVAEKEGDRLMRAAAKADRERNNDLYEALESEAVCTSRIAGNIRKLKKQFKLIKKPLQPSQ